MNACSSSSRLTLASADCDLRLLGLVGAVRVVDVLPRHRVALDQILIAIGRRLRQSRVGLRGGEIRARLQQLLIDLGRVDLGQHLARLHARSDVGVALLQVAGRSARRSRRRCTAACCRAARSPAAAAPLSACVTATVGDRQLARLARQRPSRRARAPRCPTTRRRARDRASDDDDAAIGDRGRCASRRQLIRRGHAASISCGRVAGVRVRCSSANTAGTKNSVATVANVSPPMTARPSGAFCSPPSPSRAPSAPCR